MELFNNIKNSIYSPKFYKELQEKPFSFSVKYFVLFALIVILIATVSISFAIVPAIKIFIGEFGPQIISYYPEELQLTIKNGEAFTNVEEPYLIKIPDELKDKKSIRLENNNFPELENALVIDTKNDFNLERFNSYKTFALLTKDSIISYTDKGINISKIDENTNFYLDKNKISSFYDKVKPFINFIYPVIISVIFIGNLLIFLWQIIYLFFGALVVWMVFKIKKIKINYKKAYQFGLHLMTPVILIEMVFNVFRLNLYIPFMFTILLFVITLINIKNIQKYEIK